MIYERLILMRDLSSQDGSIHVHCDYRVSALMRLVLDEVFGRDAIRNRFLWPRYTVAVKVIDIFGNDTMTLVPVSVG